MTAKSLLPAILMVVLPALCGVPSDASDRLTNGDFELAGAVGSKSYGPGWSGNDSLEVLGPGGPEGAQPYSGKRFVGKTAEGTVASGTVEQTIQVPPGVHTVSFQGRVWVYTPPDNPFRTSGVTVKLWVDNVEMRAETVAGPDKQWVPISLVWTGPVTSTLKVLVLCQAEGRSGPRGVAAVDNLTLDVSAPVSRPNLLVNGGFEQAGSIGSQNAGPGWFRTGDLQVVGSPWFQPKDSPSGAYERTKAMGLYTNGGVANGTLGQFVTIPAGTYALSLRGHIYLWDEFGYDGNAHYSVELLVDGVRVKYQQLQAYFDAPNGGWHTLDWQWAGVVQGVVSLVVTGHVNGTTPDSESVAVFDDWYLNVFDTSKPTTPVVIDDGDTTPISTQLHATWSAEDPQTGVDNYQYSIGTAPGLTDVVHWTDIGLATGTTRYGLSLPVGGTYYFNVRARNYQGYYGETGSSDGITIVSPPQPISIGEARALPDGTYVKLTDKAVSQRIGSDAWLEELDRTAGIRLATDVLYSVFPGSRQNVLGRLATRDGERVLELAAPQFNGQQYTVKPINAGTRDIGGGSAGDHTPGVADGRGANNVGLLMRVTGRITAVGDGYYYVDDGAGLRDGTFTGDAENVGLRVIGPVGAAVAGDMVRASGASSTFLPGGGEPARALRATSAPVRL